MEFNLKTPTLFSRTRKLEGQIDDFLDIVTQSGLIFKSAMEIYLEKGACKDFDDLLAQMEGVEKQGDNLRRDIETKLYIQTLIPDLRGVGLQRIRQRCTKLSQPGSPVPFLPA